MAVQQKKKVIIYTDGACSGNPGPGAYGAVLMYGDVRKEISGGFSLTTNNRMEILAAVKALSLLKEPCDVQLYSDSKYLVDAIEKKWLANWQLKNWMRGKNEKVLNKDLWLLLIEKLAIHTVKFIWVKGHASNIENERCDALAREFITCGELDTDEGYSA